MNNRKAFTLIELMIVVVIIGILAAIAIPKFTSIQDTARQSACRTNMRCLATAEAMYYGLFDTFTANVNDLLVVQDNADLLICPLDHVVYILAMPGGPDHYTATCASGASHGSFADGICSWQ